MSAPPGGPHEAKSRPTGDGFSNQGDQPGVTPRILPDDAPYSESAARLLALVGADGIPTRELALAIIAPGLTDADRAPVLEELDLFRWIPTRPIVPGGEPPEFALDTSDPDADPAAVEAELRALLVAERCPSSRFAWALWGALPPDREWAILDELRRDGWKLDNTRSAPEFVRAPETPPTQDNPTEETVTSALLRLVESTPETGSRGYRLVSSIERNARPPLVFTVADTLPEYGAGQIVGPSYQGKTYVGLDLALSLCNDGVEEWFGRSIAHHGPVVYVLMEGSWDAPQRIKAWLSGHPGCTDERLFTIEEEALNLGEAKDILRLQRAVEGIQPAAVFIDTQALATPGAEENSNSDMGVVFANLKALATRLHCVVATVHHTGHEKSRARGASAQFAASDFVISVAAQKVRAEKVKAYKRWDDAAGFRFVEVELLGGERGAYIEPVTGLAGLVAAHAQATGAVESAILDLLLHGPKSGNQIEAG